MKYTKRIVAMLLCLMMVLPLLPISSVIADTADMNKIEAEDTENAVWNGYNKTENNKTA